MDKDETFEIIVNSAVDEFMSHGNKVLALALAQQQLEEMGLEFNEKQFKRAFTAKIVKDMKKDLGV